MYTSLLPLSPLQGQISSSLDYVENQQKDLSSILDSYEEQIGGLVEQSGTSNGWRGNSGLAEKEREKACVVSYFRRYGMTDALCRYALATNLSTSLDTTFLSLSSLIQTLNSLSPSVLPTTAQSTEDPLTQIAAILNAHLSSLQWIESTTENLKGSVRELEGRVSEAGVALGVNTGSTAAGWGKRGAGGGFGSSVGAGGGSPFGRR